MNSQTLVCPSVYFSIMSHLHDKLRRVSSGGGWLEGIRGIAPHFVTTVTAARPQVPLSSLSIHNYRQNGELPSRDTWPVTRAFNYSLVTLLLLRNSGSMLFNFCQIYNFFFHKILSIILKLFAPNTPVCLIKIKKYFYSKFWQRVPISIFTWLMVKLLK